MRAFALKHKGKSIWQNMMFDRELTFSDGDKVFAGLLFFRKKDAKKYLETFQYKEFYEIIGVTIDKSDKDNRVSSNGLYISVPALFTKISTVAASLLIRFINIP